VQQPYVVSGRAVLGERLTGGMPFKQHVAPPVTDFAVGVDAQVPGLSAGGVDEFRQEGEYFVLTPGVMVWRAMS
jgi:hypothetical protein